MPGGCYVGHDGKSAYPAHARESWIEPQREPFKQTARLSHGKTSRICCATHNFSPDDKAVRLAPEHHDGTSLTAVAVAAHEVGHAFQDRDGYRNT